MKQPLDGAPRNSRLVEYALLVAVMVPQLSNTSVSPLTGVIGGEYGVASGSQLISVFLLGYAISMPVSGFVADAIGARRLLIIGLTGAGIAALIPLVVPGWTAMLASRFLVGLLGCAATVVTRVYIRRGLAPDRHMPALTLLALGVAVCPCVAPLLGSGLGVSVGWRVLLGVLSALLFLAAVGMVAFVAPDSGRDEGVAGASEILGSYRAALTNGRFLAAALSISLVSMSYFSVLSHGAETLQPHGISSGLMGVLLGIAALGFISSSTYLRRTQSRRAATLITVAASVGLIGSVILAASGIEALGTAGTFVIAAVGLAALFAAVGVIFPATQAELLVLKLPRHAIASGLFFFIQLVGGAVYSTLLDTIGISTPGQLSLAAILPLVGILAVMGVAQLSRH